jgi:hypothetical protein
MAPTHNCTSGGSNSLSPQYSCASLSLFALHRENPGWLAFWSPIDGARSPVLLMDLQELMGIVGPHQLVQLCKRSNSSMNGTVLDEFRATCPLQG